MAAKADWVDGQQVTAATMNALGTEVNTKATSAELATAIGGRQPADVDLSTIAGLTPATDSFMQAKGNAWSARTVAQVKTDLGLAGTNSGDQDLSGLQPLDADLTALAAMTAPATKLAGIEALADVTDAGNVGPAIHGATAKTAPASNDELALIDSAASNALKRITYGDLSTAIVALIAASAPSTLDTLQELAAALGNDPNFATTITTALGLKAPLASPAFTGTPTGITKTHVGLSNVTNNAQYYPGGTDVAIADGGTGVSTLPSGLLKGAGTSAITAATAGTDYVSPSSTETQTNKTLTNPTVTNYVETAQTKATVTTSKTLDPSTGTVIPLQLTASTACTVTMPTAAAGKSLLVPVYQAVTTGLGTITFTGVKWAGGTTPTMTPTAAKMDLFSFWSDGTSWYGTVAQNFTP